MTSVSGMKRMGAIVTEACMKSERQIKNWKQGTDFDMRNYTLRFGRTLRDEVELRFDLTHWRMYYMLLSLGSHE